jgi:hypothetical protein
LGVGVINLAAINPDFIQARHHCLAHLVDGLQLGNPFADVFADDAFLRRGAADAGKQQGKGKPKGKAEAKGYPVFEGDGMVTRAAKKAKPE